MERFGVFVRGGAFDATQAQDRLEGVLRHPRLAAAFAAESSTDVLDLARANFFVEGDKEVRPAEIAVVLGNLVLQDQVAAPRVPGEVTDGAVVLVPVIPIVGEDQIRIDVLLELLEELLDVGSLVREKAVPEIRHDDLLLFGALKEKGRAGAGFPLTFPWGAEHHPRHMQVATRAKQLRDRPAAANFDIVRMSPQTQ